MKLFENAKLSKGAVDFIDQYRDQPFFLYMATTLPHVPGPLESLKADPRITAAGMLEAPITGCLNGPGPPGSLKKTLP